MLTKKRIAAAMLLLICVGAGSIMLAFTVKGRTVTKRISNRPAVTVPKPAEKPLKACVFKTVFGEEPSDSFYIYKTPGKVTTSISDALEWMEKAQFESGGWGAGSNSRQGIMDPHAVPADPATTAMVCMALLRCDNTPTEGKYATNLKKGINFLLNAVEETDEKAANITKLTGTQPQVKLGSNIDVILTSQCLTNLTHELKNDDPLKARVEKCQKKCLAIITRGQDANGKWSGGGWAGVLQSSLANNALETAEDAGYDVDKKALEKSRDYQKQNFDSESGSIKTDDAAGIMLYSVSSTGRASAVESKQAKAIVDQAKKEGKLSEKDEVTVETLKKTGLSESEALKYKTAYDINTAASQSAQREDIMNGFGNNGGEEFLSYLMTGEGMVISKDYGWKKWYDNVSGKLLKIQNQDGSWNGHHCITSPVYCTATCLLILSINNDIERLASM